MIAGYLYLTTCVGLYVHCDNNCRSQPHVTDRDYAELSQLEPVPSESQWRRTAAGNVNDQGPSSRGPVAVTDGLLLGNSALNARYMSGQQQQQVPV